MWAEAMNAARQNAAHRGKSRGTGFHCVIQYGDGSSQTIFRNGERVDEPRSPSRARRRVKAKKKSTGKVREMELRVAAAEYRRQVDALLASLRRTTHTRR